MFNGSVGSSAMHVCRRLYQWYYRRLYGAIFRMYDGYSLGSIKVYVHVYMRSAMGRVRK
jgi:hypothetical protein